MITEELLDLVEQAKIARKRAYAPYSRFRVGAAVRTDDGNVYTGVNVENASYGATCCAERVAMFQVVSQGAGPIRAIAVVADAAEPVPPCGICRQVMVELAPQAVVVMANLEGKLAMKGVAELLPAAFGGEFF